MMILASTCPLYAFRSMYSYPQAYPFIRSLTGLSQTTRILDQLWHPLPHQVHQAREAVLPMGRLLPPAHLPVNRQASVHPIPTNQESASCRSRTRSRSIRVILAERCVDYCLGPRFEESMEILRTGFPTVA
jgi:hypothetical protein